MEVQAFSRVEGSATSAAPELNQNNFGPNRKPETELNSLTAVFPET